MSSQTFEMKEYARPATEAEREEQVLSLLSVIKAIHTTRGAAKAAAADFKAKIEDLVVREDELRTHLEMNTFIEGVEVHAIVNEMSGNTEYWTKEGDEIIELRHPTSKQEKRDEAAKRQTSMFGEDTKTPNDAPTPFDKETEENSEFSKRLDSYSFDVDNFEARTNAVYDSNQGEFPEDDEALNGQEARANQEASDAHTEIQQPELDTVDPASLDTVAPGQAQIKIATEPGSSTTQTEPATAVAGQPVNGKAGKKRAKV